MARYLALKQNAQASISHGKLSNNTFTLLISKQSSRWQNPQTHFSFGVVADVQYANYPHRGNRYYQQSRLKLKQCVQNFNSKDLSFVIQLGDLIDGGFDNIGTMSDIYQQLQMPKYHVLGNHDFPASRIGVMNKLGLEKGYYDFVVEDFRFIVLDGNEISLYANQNGSEKVSVRGSTLWIFA